jgi:hypothetical protein
MDYDFIIVIDITHTYLIGRMVTDINADVVQVTLNCGLLNHDISPSMTTAGTAYFINIDTD